MKIGETDIRIKGRLVRIAYPELEKYELLQDPAAVIDALRTARPRVDLFTFLQITSDNAPKYSYAMEMDNMAVLPITTFDDWWKQLRSEARNRARQAEKKGVVVREVEFGDELAKGMWGVYNESPMRQGKPNVHYGKDVATVYRDEATFLDRSVFIGAFLGEELIGFVKLVTDKERTHANMMNVVAMVKYRDKAPTNALIAQAVRSCAARSIRYLAYQGFTYGKQRIDSLTNFKVINGFQRVDLPRYYVPLTPLGTMFFRLGLHRNALDWLPVPVADKFRELRTAWYKRRLEPANGISR
jgi:hypothetical protein